MIKFLYNGSYKTLTKNKEPTTATSAKPNGTLQTEESASAVETLFAVCYAPPSVNTNTTTNGLAQSFAPTTSTADLFDLPRDLFGPTISTGTTTSTTNLFHPFRPSRSLSGPNIAAIPTTSTTSLFVPSEDLFGLKYPATDYSREASSIFDGMPAFDQYPNVELFAEDLINHAKVYIIAEKYDIQPLKIFARDNYSSVSYNHWNSSCFVESIELIFDNTPDIFKGDTLRRTAVEVASKHMRELLAREDFTQMCQERGDIATSILQFSSGM